MQQVEDLELERREVGLEDLDDFAVTEQAVPLDVVEDLKHAVAAIPRCKCQRA
jgi:hypothetical protein